MAALKLADREDGAHTRNLSNFSTGSVVEHELDDPEAGHISEDALASAAAAAPTKAKTGFMSSVSDFFHGKMHKPTEDAAPQKRQGRPPLNGGSAQAPSSATGASIGPFGTSQPAQQEQQVQADGRSQQKGAQPPDRMTSARRVSFNSQLARSASEVTDDEQSGGQYSDHEHDESRDMHALGHSGMPGERDVRKEHRGLDFPSSSDSNQRSTQLALVVPQHGGSSSFGLDREFDSPGKAGGGLKARAPLTDAEIRATKLARAKRRLRAMLAINHHEYMENLGPLAPHAKPSTLQRLVKRAFNSTSTFCKVAPSLDGLSAEGLLLDGTGQLSPQPKVPQFSLTLVSVKGLASTGVAGRQAWLQVARMCLYDGRRFLGNVQAVKPRKLANNGSSWVFDPVPFLVRAGRVQKDLQVVIEFNISYELTSTEAANLSASHRRAAAQVDEITLGWAVVNAAELCKVQKELTVNIQLLGGSLTHCNLLSRYNSAVPPVTGMLSRLMSLGGTPSPTLVIKASPTRLNAAEAAAAAMLPPQAIVAPALQQVLAVYRGIMAQQLAQAGSYMASVADPVLVTFPRIVDDAELCSAFLRLWEQHISPRVSPSTVELELVFKQTVMMMWPLLHSQAVLQPTIANFMAHQGERGKKMAEFMALHPVTSMSHRSAEWLHKPFAASELVVHAYGGLGHTV
ncbi:hypothetical protein WJX72_011683 [[Myrmecia] bisecta]|uniref:Uncharacterized protein n=1 Tax=[Myrmecia] bisecta TaxID=41462 RepID=A0AAW1Q887_9CHLO